MYEGHGCLCFVILKTKLCVLWAKTLLCHMKSINNSVINALLFKYSRPFKMDQSNQLFNFTDQSNHILCLALDLTAPAPEAVNLCDHHICIKQSTTIYQYTAIFMACTIWLWWTFLSLQNAQIMQLTRKIKGIRV